jgi:hypothetical protein
MSVTPIQKPLPGEDLLGIEPELLQQTDPGWRRRLSLFTGRALSDTALRGEQEYRSGRLALLGQAVTPGTVLGLEISMDPTAADPVLQVAPGYGLLATGEDLTLLQPLQTKLSALTVLNLESGALPTTFDKFRADPANKNHAGVFVLQPISADVNGAQVDSGTGPIEVTGQLGTSCDQDPELFAFEDWQTADGARLVLVAWPSLTAALQLPATSPAATFRNRCAYTVFNAELSLGPDDTFPWQLAGVPLALVGFDDGWKPLFLDRSSVVRSGGLRRRRYVLPAMDVSGTSPKLVQPALAEARIAQLAEQISESKISPNLAAGFVTLPPVGILPAVALDLVNRKNLWFPANWIIRAAPIHSEELETALRTGMTDGPLDVTQPEPIEVLVPLSDDLYDPNIFVTETVAPEFQQEFAKATQQRTIALQHRKDIQLKSNVLLNALGQTAIDPDADLSAAEKAARDGVLLFQPSPNESFGTATKNNVLVSTDNQHLHDVAAAAPYTVPLPNNQKLALISDDDFKDLTANGLQHFIDRINAKISRADDLLDLAFLTSQTDIYRFRQNVLGATDATRLATSTILANLATGETAAATAANLRTYLNSVTTQPSTPSAPSGAAPTPAPPTPTPTPPTGVTATTPSVSRTGLLAERSTFITTISPTPVLRVSTPAPPALTVRTGAAERATITSGVTAFRPTFQDTGGLGAKADISVGVVRDLTPFQRAAVPDLTPTPTAPTTTDIQAQSPIVGAQLNLRTLTIAERLKQSPAQEGMFYSVANRIAFLQLLLTLEIPMDDLQFLVDAPPPPPPAAGTPPAATSSIPPIATETHTIAELRDAAASPAIWAKIQAPRIASDADEAHVFSVGVRVLEQHSQLLRVLESRIQLYRDFVTLCASSISAIRADLDQARALLARLENDLTEARQNLNLIAALLADETKRVDDVNNRRTSVLRQYVPLIAYTRARTMRVEADAPSRQLVPGNVVSPVPACLQQSVAIPPELREMVSLLREAPLAWLPSVNVLLPKLERPNLLHELAMSAQVRASVQVQLPLRASSAATQSGVYAPVISGIYSSHQQVFRGFQEQRASSSLSQFGAQSWNSQVEILSNFAAIADLLAAEGVHAEIASATSRLIQQISSVATCLYVRVGLTLPVDRLEWAEYLRGPGATVPLRNLYVLPKWNTQDYVDRQQMQLLVDWLFQQIDQLNPAATAFMSDVVRVCILLASHAPTNEIIVGEVVQRFKPAIGYIIPLTLPSGRIAHGMNVQIFRAGELAAAAIVSDLDSSNVRATVTAVYKANDFIEAKDMVHFSAQAPQAAALRAFAK